MKSLYRCFDASGGLLYIGVTKNVSRRMGQHKVCSHWFHLVASTSFDPPVSAKEAHARERRAIRSERPKCNTRGNPARDSKFLEAARLNSNLAPAVRVDSDCTFGKEVMAFVRRVESARTSHGGGKSAENAILDEASAAGYMKRTIRSLAKQRANIRASHVMDLFNALEAST